METQAILLDEDYADELGEEQELGDDGSSSDESDESSGESSDVGSDPEIENFYDEQSHLNIELQNDDQDMHGPDEHDPEPEVQDQDDHIEEQFSNQSNNLGQIVEPDAPIAQP